MTAASDTTTHNSLLNTNRLKIKLFSGGLGVPDPVDLECFPKFIQIETVSICNGACIICPVREAKRSSNRMDDFLFNKLLAELKVYAHWIERVTVQMLGEPLLDERLEDKIRALKQIGIKHVCFTTNASLMDAARSRTLLESGLDSIDFSVDGTTADVYESIRPGFNFEEVVANIKEFIRFRELLQKDVPLRIRMTISELNKFQLDGLADYWRQYLKPCDKVYGKLLNSWTNWLDGYSLPESQDRDMLNASPCVSPFGSFPIQSDGKVAICCQDYNASVCMGDLNQHTIKEIWQSARYREVRRLHLENGRGVMPCCRDCNVWDESTRVVV